MRLRRRALLKWSAAAAVLGACKPAPKPVPRAAGMPSIFLAHGAPPLLDDAGWVSELGGWAKALPRPSAVLMISAHWATRPACLGATSAVPLVYDYSGFPDRFYQLQYPAPGSPDLAARVHAMLEEAHVPCADLPQRGLDHGAFVPLLCMYPRADVPVLQLSLPGLEPADALALGQRLAPLREEGVLVVGSGFLTHNLREGFGEGGTPAWASEFDAWAQQALTRRDVDALVDFRAKAPAAARAHPTIEHYLPVLVALGASADGAAATFPITGFWNDSAFTRRSVQFC
jgi:4,5-DOPA dioxygenase extradiol